MDYKFLYHILFNAAPNAIWAIDEAEYSRARRLLEAVPYDTNRGANGLLPNGNISSLATPSALRATVSLRLGHGAALTCHRHVIHYRAAVALP